MSALESLTRDYRAALLHYLSRREEAALHRGYLLGRAAVTEGLSLLDVARVHHDLLLEVLRETPTAELPDLAMAAAEFLLEVLATSDMTQRGYLESRHGNGAGPPTGEQVQGPSAEGGYAAARLTAAARVR
jgi:hypothetical protein